MPLLGNSKQNKDRSLEEFYSDLQKDKINPISEKIGIGMLAFIEMINTTFKHTEIWGLTSILRLVLQNRDEWSADWLVIVTCVGSNEYYFEYLMPDDKKPWEGATVKGVTQNLTEAKRYLLIAMKESGGWRENDELRELLFENNID